MQEVTDSTVSNTDAVAPALMKILSKATSLILVVGTCQNEQNCKSSKD
jgi:hypothetical protein